MRTRVAAAIALLLSLAMTPALRAQTPVRFSAAAALALPIGDLGDAADIGFNLGLRGEGRLARPGWSLRGDLSWDHFGGKGFVDSYSYLGVAANLLHRSTGSKAYQFGGLGLYSAKTAFVDRLNTEETNVGMQLGVGLDFKPGDVNTFLEFGLTDVFTSGSSSLWFPLRFGIRF